MIKNYKLNGWKGSYTLDGYFDNGASHLTLPIELGRNTYRIHVQQGDITLRHETRGYDVPTAPLDGQPGKYSLESGKVYEISFVAGKTYGVLDGALISNDRYFKSASFFVEVLEVGGKVNRGNNAVLEFTAEEFYGLGDEDAQYANYSTKYTA